MLWILCFWGFPGGSDHKESACLAEDLGSIPGLGRPPRESNGYSLQYSCLGESHGQRSLVGHSPQGHKELDTTEQLTLNSMQISLFLKNALTIYNQMVFLLQVLTFYQMSGHTQPPSPLSILSILLSSSQVTSVQSKHFSFLLMQSHLVSQTPSLTGCWVF